MERIVSALGLSLPIVFVLSLILVFVIRHRGRNGRAGGAGVLMALIALAAPFEHSFPDADACVIFAIGLAGVTILAWNLERDGRKK
jgi:hypothetical protein